MPEEDVTDVLRAEGKNNKDQKDKDNTTEFTGLRGLSRRSA